MFDYLAYNELRGMVVVRIWEGRVPKEKADEYGKFLIERAVPDYKSVPGNLGVYILKREEGNAVKFMIITLWQDIDSIKVFAGEDYEKTKYYPEDEDFLLEFPEKVRHYELLYRE
ncbi:antibiotic biosynthesis monooxygenase [Ignicoccus pacificus DSM 13166]|uniref:Antibiotic biosynthesis monooxygenase n=1 Tax=Ignicoccus pacificus DSM 13166 TaxID=940294 RepID=A0A977PKD6_9CREN|nr:antibiotic biosynthesis monooxygenase [Ignicoccus pacificus DSM 13166]